MAAAADAALAPGPRAPPVSAATAAAAGDARAALAGRFVDLDVKLLGWSHMDKRLRLAAGTHLGAVKVLLAAKHGRMASLTLWRDAPAPDNVLADDGATLAALGFPLAPQPGAALLAAPGAAPVVGRLVYDFTPADARNPTLLAVHTRGKPGVDAGAL